MENLKSSVNQSPQSLTSRTGVDVSFPDAITVPTPSPSPATLPTSPPDSHSHSSSTNPPAASNTPVTDPHSPPHLDTFKWFDNVIFELNDVFLLSPDSSQLDIRTKSIHYDIITSLAWSDFEKGLIGLDECRAQLAAFFTISDAQVADAVDAAMSWRISPEMRALATTLSSTHALYAIGNLPQPVFDRLSEPLDSSHLFQHIFPSCALGERLPYPAFLTAALASIPTPLDPTRTLYLGRHVDNLITARAFSFHTIAHTDPAASIARTASLTRDPLRPARAWLRAHAGALHLTTSLGITVKDAYMQTCILDVTGDPTLLYPDLDTSLTLFSWIHGAPPPGLPAFPPDLDCNSLAYTTYTHLPASALETTLSLILDHLDRSSGLLPAYLDQNKPRLDMLMLVNGLTLFHHHGQAHRLPAATADFLFNVLDTRAFRNGTHYYPSPDLFLYFVSRLLQRAPLLRPRFGHLFRDCVLERAEAGDGGDALAVAARVVVMARCGVRDQRGLERLLEMGGRGEEGVWGAGVVYRFNRVEGWGWHRGFTVAVAVRAVEEWEALRKRGGGGV